MSGGPPDGRAPAAGRRITDVLMAAGAAAVAGFLAVTGVVLLLAPDSPAGLPAPPVTAALPAPAPAVARPVAATATPAAAAGPATDAEGVEAAPAAPVLAEPSRVLVSAIGVDSSLIRLGLDEDGSLQTPEDPDVAGWWAGGVAPGDVGPAVLVGHVDSTRGPAVFYRVRELQPGDEVVVTGAEGEVTFVVDSVKQYAKDAFPTEDVYGGTDRPTLRLVTCGGTFDRSTGHYEDNVVAYATAR